MDFLEKVLDVTASAVFTYGTRLIFAAIILLVGFKIVNFILKKVSKSKGWQRLDPSVQSFTKSFINIAAKIIIVITAIAVLGVPMASIVAVLGTLGLAIGLAVQGGLANLAGGVLILIFKPFVIGDYVKTEAGHEGTVEKIDIFYTVLRKPDNTRIVVPNGALSNQAVYDVSAYETRRVDLTFTASYSNDIDTVVGILKDVAAKNEKVIKDDDNAPFASLLEHGDNALKYVLRVWCKKEDYWSVYFDLCKNVKNEFDAKGVEIPFPQVDVHIKENGSKE